MDGKVTRISVLGQESIVIGCGLLAECGRLAHEACKAVRYVVITDENVAPLYLEKVMASFEAATGARPIVKVLPHGESQKCRGVKAEIEDWMLEHRCGRDAAMVALGGGVIGDLTGFVAATFMRGIKVVQIPTTLLAMVDSSIGGKTGIDTPGGKNLVGAFHHPMRIIMDLEVLKSLPQRQLCNGMAEVVKTALLWDADRFTELEEHVDEILAYDSAWLQSIVEGSAGIKAEVVTKDEKEGGLRTLLNVGHSIGHAVEAYLQPEMLHGEAVSIGTVKEAHLSRRLGYISEAEVGRITRCLQAFKLPVAIPAELEWEGLLAKMAVDKKNKGGKKFISLLERIGKCVNNKAIAVEDKDIASVLAHGVEVVPLEGDRHVKLEVPGSKSLSNRALLIAALGSGTCRVRGLLHSDDTQVMLQALQAMHACTFDWEDKGETLVLKGNGGQLKNPDGEVYLGNAGTASRFLTTAAALAKPAGSVLTGNKRMKERPIAPLVTALRENGVGVEYVGRSQECLPIKVDGSKGLPGGSISLAADVSSQYVSSVLISAPYAESPVALSLVGGKVVSQPYIDMTMSIMASFGVTSQRLPDSDTYVIPTGGYKNPAAYQVEPDASSATYPLAIAAVNGAGTTVTVQGMGSASVQGDANFAKLLEQMGCSVLQTESSTTVTGPEGRLKAVDVDMEPMTDAFMTAAVLMALADGTSRITGIANQRVKECNRIEAMMTEFKKLGVVTRELPDGLEVDGTTPDKLAAAVDIFCYKDHRIAMSFAVLGTRVPGITLMDAACVDKTYPVFWDHLANKFRADLRPRHVVAGAAAQQVSADESVVLVGIRGAGKTTLGNHCADRLGWDLVDMDDVFDAKAGAIKEYIASHGWDAFRAKEADLLVQTLREHPQRAIICTGGGIVESAPGRDALKGSRKVVFINKSLADTEAGLAACGKPAWGESIEAVYNRRFPLFRAASQFELPVDSTEGWAAVCKDALRLLEHVTQRAEVAPVRAMKSFLSLTFPDVDAAAPYLAEAACGTDALELRVDLLSDLSAENVAKQVVKLRRLSPLPVIFTVRSEAQGGRFPNGQHERMLTLLQLAVRLGCEFVDVEATLKDEDRQELLDAVRPSKVILSHHDPHAALSWEQVERKIAEMGQCTTADVVKFVTSAKTVDDCARLRAAVRAADIATPVIALAMGEHGKLSRALNEVMTPITHPSLPVAAAPGQLTLSQINSLRRLIGALPDQRAFCLFGSPITHSRSPLIHNTGFAAVGLAPGWAYAKVETDSIDAVKAAMAAPEWGGASVTIPLKEQVAALCDSVSDVAEKIGAVNTLVKRRDGSVYGDNTDWVAMRDLALRNLTHAPKVGLCIGAGGSARAACYALKALGVQQLYVWNRTAAKAEALAAEFGGTAAVDLSGVAADIVISNIPGNTQDASLPAFPLAASAVVIEMAFAPRKTRLLAQAEAAGATCVEGVAVLIEQALHQFKHWTGLNAPRAAISNAVYADL
eukprot:TRINITY_DN19177_c0_g1_i1.p1 TRINITY_DN19177_c0_g1~~TRINITY_DN19177_c0_g1_i1.p1  ORF type:complete len:1486 (+),score=579.95 TRINITY_DN19177_c0_g1_i1:68-4525(+)